MKAITFALELLEPLMATGLEGDPNSNVTLDYIPGSVIRGALIGHYLNDKSKRELAFDGNERELFFDGSVRYLNAYPLIRLSLDEVRSLPTPLSLYAKKGAEPGATVHDLSYQSLKDAFGDEQSKQVSLPFFHIEGQEVFFLKPMHRLAIHAQRERRHGRSVQGDGAVFRYDALAAGTRFGGVILAKNDSSIGKLESLLKETQLNLGGSRTAGYGGVRVQGISVIDNWNEAALPQGLAEIAKGRRFTITLLSHTIVRNENGQHCAELSLIDLRRVLGDIAPARGEHDSTGGDFNATFKQSEIVGGFNRKWGLPLPQTLALKAGSVFSFEANDGITKGKVEELIAEGIGERRVEGFGRVAVNLNQQPTLEWLELKKPRAVEPYAIERNSLSAALAERMLERLIRRKLDLKLIEKVANRLIHHAPPNHQISRLRAVVRGALRSGDKELILAYFKKHKRTAREHFEQARVDGINLRAWIEERLNKLDENFDDFQMPVLGHDDGRNELIAAQFTDKLKLEYHLRLIDGVLAHAAKAND